MMDVEAHPNVRLFVARVLLDRASHFQPYAQHWFRPVLQLILALAAEGAGLNYFVNDLCVMLLTWTAMTSLRPASSERVLAAKLLEFTMQHVRAASPAVFRNNVNLIKSLVEQWRPLLAGAVPYRVIFEAMDARAADGGMAGIHLYSVVLGNELAPLPGMRWSNQGWALQPAGMDTAEGGDKVSKALAPLVAAMGHKSRSIYRAAATVLGMAMAALAGREGEPGYDGEGEGVDGGGRRDMEEDEDKDTGMAAAVVQTAAFLQPLPVALLESVCYALTGMVEGKSAETDRFLICLHGVAHAETGYPPLADGFMPKIFFYLPGLNGSFKTLALELVQWRAAQAPRRTYRELRSKDLLGLITHRQGDVQTIVLRALLAMLNHLTIKEIASWYLAVTAAFAKHSAAACRGLFYDLLMALYDRHLRHSQGHEDLDPDLGSDAEDAEGDDDSNGTGAEYMQSLSAMPMMEDEDDAALFYSDGGLGGAAGAGGGGGGDVLSGSAPGKVDLTNLRAVRRAAPEEVAEALFGSVQAHLLLGLADGDEEVRGRLYAFWDSGQRLSLDMLPRLMQLLQLYTAPAEDTFLQASTTLLLLLTNHSPDINRHLFEHPLSNCTWRDMPIDAGWRMKNFQMTPLFVATQGGSSSSQSTMMTQGRDQAGLLLATAQQSLMNFTPTFAGGSVGVGGGRGSAAGAAGGGMGGMPSFLAVAARDFGTARMLSQSSSSPSSSSSVLMFDRQQQRRRQRQRLLHGASQVVLGGLRSGGGSGTSGSITAETLASLEATETAMQLQRLRQRFPKLDSLQRAGRPLLKAIMMMERRRKEEKQRRQKERRSRVTMLRQYRAGELPDIQISARELLVPMQVISQKDVTFASQLFTRLLAEIYRQLRGGRMNDFQGASQRAEETRFGELLGRLLHTSVLRRSAFIAAVQQLLALVPEAPVDAQVIYATSVASNNFFTGVLLLEARLRGSGGGGGGAFDGLDESLGLEHRSAGSGGAAAAGGGGGRSHKRARPSGRTAAPSHGRSKSQQHPEDWLALARMHRRLDDLDLMRGLVAEDFGCKPETVQALAAEARGDLPKAETLYQQAIDRDPEDWPDHMVPAGEADLWEDQHTEVLQLTGGWAELEQAVLSLADANYEDDNQAQMLQAMEKLWQQPRLQEFHLRPLLQSMIKQAVMPPEQVVRGAAAEEWEELRKAQLDRLWAFVQRALQHPGRRRFLEATCTQELALVFFLRGDTDRARFYLATGMERFVQEWAGLHDLMRSSRTAALQGLQPVAEMYQALEEVRTTHMSLDRIKATLGTWAERRPAHLRDNMNVWDDVATMRTAVLRELTASFQRELRRQSDMLDEEPALAEASGASTVFLVRMLYSFSHESLDQCNMPATSRLIRMAYSTRELAVGLDKAAETMLAIEHDHAASRVRLELARDKASLNKCAKFMEKVTICLGRLAEGPDTLSAMRQAPELWARHNRLMADSMQNLAAAVGRALREDAEEWEEGDREDGAGLDRLTPEAVKHLGHIMSAARDSLHLLGGMDAAEDGGKMCLLDKVRGALGAAGTETLGAFKLDSRQRDAERERDWLLSLEAFFAHASCLFYASAASGGGGDGDGSGAGGGGGGGGVHELPLGWEAVPSRSRPGAMSYLNIVSQTRMAKAPAGPAVAGLERIGSCRKLLPPAALEAQMHLFAFAQSMREQDVQRSALDRRELALAMLQSLLTALRSGSSEAHERFPQLLLLLGEHCELVDAFVALASDVPSWLFIAWISQACAILDQPEGRAVNRILERLAADYPAALVYPLRISSEALVFGSGGEQQKVLVERLQVGCWGGVQSQESFV